MCWNRERFICTCQGELGFIGQYSVPCVLHVLSCLILTILSEILHFTWILHLHPILQMSKLKPKECLTIRIVQVQATENLTNSGSDK